MSVSLAQLEIWMRDKEDEGLEFKEAKGGFHFEELVNYCVALANEGGGKIIFGVSDKLPRRIVGTNAFTNLERTKLGIYERLRFRVDIDEVLHSGNRVLVFHIPPRPIGMPLQYEGAYWMRSGESLVPMTPDTLKTIFAETGLDFSAEFCQNATFSDLDSNAVEAFRNRWIKNQTHCGKRSMLATKNNHFKMVFSF